MAVLSSQKKKLPPVALGEALKLGLGAEEWDKILEGLGRAPNEVECAVFAAIWAEDISYKSSRSLLRTLAGDFTPPADSPQINGRSVSLIDVGDEQMLAFVVDHKNFSGGEDPGLVASTAVHAVLHDLAAVGDMPLDLLNLLRFGNIETSETHRLLRRSIQGLASSGNALGVPTIGGDLYFHPRYDSGVILNSVALGLIERGTFTSSKAPVGSPLLYVGSQTGFDGLRGELADGSGKAGSNLPRPMVNDPHFERTIIESMGQALHNGSVLDVVQLGRGGLAVAGIQMASRVNQGIRVDVDKVPMLVPTMTHKQLLLSESPQRFLVLAPHGKHREVVDLFSDAGIGAVMIGELVDSDDLELNWRHNEISEIPFRFAASSSIEKTYQISAAPPMRRKKPRPGAQVSAGAKKREAGDEWSALRSGGGGGGGAEEIPENLEDVWVDLLADANLCSRRLAYQQFDYRVGARVYRAHDANAAIIRLGDPGKAGSTYRGVAVTINSNSLYVAEDPYLGTVQSVAEAMRNLSAVGARPLAAAHCLNFGDPANYKEISQLSESIRGLNDACNAWNIPILSDRVSLNNGNDQNPVLPTPAVLMVGLVNDVRKTVGTAFRQVGDRVFLIGSTKNEIECSEYAYYHYHRITGQVPDIDFDLEDKTCAFVRRVVNDGLAQSVHDLAAGGLARALVECGVSGPRSFGATLEVTHGMGPDDFRPDAVLFSETSARFLISCREADAAKLQAMAETAGISITGRGAVGGKSMALTGEVETSIPLSTASRIWQNGLNHLFGIAEEQD